MTHLPLGLKIFTGVGVLCGIIALILAIVSIRKER